MPWCLAHPSRSTSSDDCRARAAPGWRSLVVVATLYNFPAIHTDPRPLMIS